MHKGPVREWKAVMTEAGSPKTIRHSRCTTICKSKTALPKIENDCVPAFVEWPFIIPPRLDLFHRFYTGFIQIAEGGGVLRL